MTDIKSNLEALKLTLVEAKSSLELDLDTNTGGFLLQEVRSSVQVSISESMKSGYITAGAWDPRIWTLDAQDSKATSPGASVTTLSIRPKEKAFAHGGGIQRLYFDMGVADDNVTHTVTVVTTPTVVRVPEDCKPDYKTGTDTVLTRQRRAFALAFDLDVLNQKFTVTFQSGDDGEPQEADANGTFVALREGLFKRKVAESVRKAKTSAPEVTDQTSGDGRVYLIFEMNSFDDVSKPVNIKVVIEPLTPSSKVSSYYDFVHEVNAQDTGIGKAESAVVAS